MENIKGVLPSKRKDGTEYYRASITYRNKHISLGSYDDAVSAGIAYAQASQIISNPEITIDKVISSLSHYELDFEKAVCLINFRDNNIYIANPIYIMNKYFYYYLSPDKVLKFNADELFFYSSHKIMQRGGHLFYADFDNQMSLLSRYGIRPHSVLGKDYLFKNGDIYDFRYVNIEILNKFYGVSKLKRRVKKSYKAVIHIKNNFTVGYYDNPVTAAIAFNKAADILKQKGYSKEYPRNDISILGVTKLVYINTYNSVSISDKIKNINFD